MRKRVCAIGFAWLLAAAGAWGQVKLPPETRNAALRYWMAFAEMKDPPSDKATQELLEKTAAGNAAWDEAKLGPILDANMGAIEMFQRASKLPDCDWGVEYSAGVRASIAYAPRSRVLARLNTLEGMREMARGQTQVAVDTWLAGLRFTSHLAKGGSLIFALIAKSSLLPNLRALNVAVDQGRLNDSQKQQVESALHAMPPDGFDWSRAWELEQAGGDQFFEKLQRSKDPKGFYEAVAGCGAPNTCVPPKAEEVRGYDQYMEGIKTALRLPPLETKKKSAEWDARESALCEAIRNIIPSAGRVNDARVEIVTTREALMQSLKTK